LVVTRNKSLSERQRLFVDAFTGEAQGNATKAAEMAGYAHPMQTGHKLIKVEAVRKAIEAATAEAKAAGAMTRARRQELLSQFAEGKAIDYHVTKEGDIIETPPLIKDRVKSIEVLGRMQGDFIEKLEIKFVELLEGKLEKLRARLSPESFTALVEALEDEE
jgi:hypothetical protein